MEQKKKATGLGPWPHALSRCGVFFPVSYYSWSSAWMSQEREKERVEGEGEGEGKKEIDRQRERRRGWKGGGKTETDRQRGKRKTGERERGTGWLHCLSLLSDLAGV